MNTITISLPSQIAKRVNAEAQKKGFATRSEFIRALLRRYFTGELKLEPFVQRPLEEVRQGLSKTGKYNQKFIDSVVKGLETSSFYER
ncbi:hypothetical protein A3B42_01300 [Candidatus Daviesbacteria bacterium RIFCSPLOWO2_01_FULL_38_10]|uniref:Ribbon-helix-helix protein CopG domain-containing protein n=1 Tax=Candidatus Daviesbacteria bacterium GW2011_GWF2_38_6 TaxID=1618432 RepID=A0A0G0NN88_9BACT|nr:MAG: hypothetical protein US99_C0017G0004 [Candidatus Daviesbacteria bacterium GW2011_GWF2_38_6]OGE26137.1 MAG: hypothetical protein A3D02_00535 [Candidatus Daviesbacteria bacterium RIFCSPHIGHO2_02_FULL_39_41]OGE37171.1 MAG: hypothetical protein A3B42_01300 [Candidatus Daviesbacteria bacterium RIFCSPLOWO2_01_FULL_38_10]OGE43798.1 MAG: hypothetical protein A3E67_03475 [Candidatus Daviesbacteria bacterium RIFCSPHIGHO2_12_FULL_38_25]OGE68229.1 MAG: hypothetical protein A3H81_04040 [Candidatus D